MQYQKGSIGKSHNEDKKYWKQYIMSGMYSGDYDLAKGKSPKFVTEKGEKYSFKVKKTENIPSGSVMIRETFTQRWLPLRD